MSEARSQAAAEIAGSDLESKFIALEAGSGVEDELAMMKQQMLASSNPAPQGALPASATGAVPSPPASEPVDAEIEALRKKIDNL
jgi:phage shock protein A